RLCREHRMIVDERRGDFALGREPVLLGAAALKAAAQRAEVRGLGDHAVTFLGGDDRRRGRLPAAAGLGLLFRHDGLLWWWCVRGVGTVAPRDKDAASILRRFRRAGKPVRMNAHGRTMSAFGASA